MKVQLAGKIGPLAKATGFELERRGHIVTANSPDAAIFFPGTVPELEQVAGVRRLIVRSNAYCYGSNDKNPGWMTEDRVSLLPSGAPEQSWLQAEMAAARHPNSASIRLANVLDPGEDGLIVQQLSSRFAVTQAGRDPNVQFLSLSDAASAMACAVESDIRGTVNAAASGAIPLRQTHRAAGVTRLPLLKPLARLAGGNAIDQLEFNWTVSNQLAQSAMGFHPTCTSVGALRAFLQSKNGARPDLLRDSYDDWGLDLDYIRAWGLWFAFLRNVYWRIECEGLENIPAVGRALLVSNHRGFMPLDAVMHLSTILNGRGRVVRFLIIHSLLRLPFLSNFLTRLGGVIASQENAAKLFVDENLVGIFPEGIRGAFSPYKSAYELRNFSKSGFAKIAIENQAPVIPSAVVGHAEIFPILGRIESSYLKREFGWPYLPIAPMFPLAPVPLPSKWHMRILPAVPLEGLRAADAENPRLVKDFSSHIQNIVQTHINDMITRRKRIFWGKLSGGTAPLNPPFRRAFSGGQIS